MTVNEIPGEVPFHGPDGITGARLEWLSPLVRQSGDDYRRDWRMRNRRLFDYLIVLFPDGNGSGQVAGEEFLFGPGDLVWIPPGTDHFMDGNCHCQFVHCDLAYSPTRSHWNAYIPGGTVDLAPWTKIVHPPLPDDEIANWRGKLLTPASSAIHTLFSGMCRTHARDPEGSHLILSGMVNQLIGLILLERDGSRQSSPWAETMRNAARNVRSTINEPLNVAELARKSGLSTSHFRKLFREYHGISPRAMHRRQRIDAACSQLIYTIQSVSEIADDLGYACIHSFSRAFKDVMGISPSNYRRAR